MTNIEWTERTWNPIVGCTIVSPGCTNCYAMRMAARIEAMARADNARRTDPHHGGKTFDSPLSHYVGTTQPSKAGPVWTGKVALAPDRVLTEPLRVRKPTMWFVNSMSDLFHESVPDEWIDRVFAVMALAPQHTFQVLTKRSAQMRAYCSEVRETWCKYIENAGSERILGHMCRLSGQDYDNGLSLGEWPLPNVWLGVSAEDQRRADERIPGLLATPAAVRFVSAEPLLGPVDFTRVDHDGDPLNALSAKPGMIQHFTPRPRTRLDWIIVGGESGKGARPMHPDWARSIRDQCAAADVPFFFKQWGEWKPEDATFAPQGDVLLPWGMGQPAVQRVGKARAGRLLDGITHDAMPTTQREVAA